MIKERARSRLRDADPARELPKLLISAEQVRSTATDSMAPAGAIGHRRGARKRILIAAATLLVGGSIVGLNLGPSHLTTKAYAVKPKPGGTIELEIKEQTPFAASEAGRLEAELNKAGLRTVVLIGSAKGVCTEQLSENQPVGDLVRSKYTGDVWTTLHFRPSELPPGTTMLIVLAPADTPANERVMSVSAHERIPSCVEYDG